MILKISITYYRRGITCLYKNFEYLNKKRTLFAGGSRKYEGSESIEN